MIFTATPGDANASPQQIVPAFGLSLNRYSKSLSASLTPTGTLSSIWSNVFSQVSTTAFKALSRATKFIVAERF